MYFAGSRHFYYMDAGGFVNARRQFFVHLPFKA